MANEEVRGLKRRLGIAEENVLIKKERLDDAQKEYEEEHRTFTVFSKRLDNRRRPILLDRKTRYLRNRHTRHLTTLHLTLSEGSSRVAAAEARRSSRRSSTNHPRASPQPPMTPGFRMQTPNPTPEGHTCGMTPDDRLLTCARAPPGPGG